ncbi:uncharacterized protein LOC132799480 [Ziziphus jujuba]|uniref:Uncharacterized protein LOC132799480 n=1 Tax=Ziziphus jujuba TaxID=326968 RepID=A0ABM3ZSG9_ZIZJJ|nr:uncharacterized protein LOC132799480 [Ziziphus jujuba]
MLGSVHSNSISKGCVVGQHFLRFKIDLSTLNPLPPGFFQDRDDGTQKWIQFKYEKLSDYCYKCGRLDHVTRACRFENPATITTKDGNTVKVYGPWFRAEHGGSIPFKHMLEDIIAQTQSREKEKEKERVSDLQPTTDQRDTRQKQFLVLEDGSKDKPLDEMHSALELCPDFNALKQTTISTGEGKLNDLYADILHQARISNFDTQTLVKWKIMIL